MWVSILSGFILIKSTKGILFILCLPDPLTRLLCSNDIALYNKSNTYWYPINFNQTNMNLIAIDYQYFFVFISHARMELRYLLLDLLEKNILIVNYFSLVLSC